MIVLGIESSCDETAASVVQLTDTTVGAKLLSNVVASSMDQHVIYGGVVPEIAARSHIEHIIPVINQAILEALPFLAKKPSKSHLDTEHRQSQEDLDRAWEQIDAVAVTYGAGLSGSLLVGVMTARSLAIAKNKPLYAVNHVEGHIYANFITHCTPTLTSSYQLLANTPKFPMLGLIVSGGHSQLVLWRGHFDYTLLGQTRDDAIGEAFDKVAKMLGLPYPGGPSVATMAKNGDSHAFNFPKARVSTGKYDYSFSGPKTAVLRACQEACGENFTFPSYMLASRLSEAQKADVAASFQRIAVETVVDKTMLAYEEFSPKSVVIGGGVAASPELRRQLVERLPCPIEYQESKLMTDNGAMVATLGAYQALLSVKPTDPYKLTIMPNLSM